MIQRPAMSIDACLRRLRHYGPTPGFANWYLSKEVEASWRHRGPTPSFGLSLLASLPSVFPRLCSHYEVLRLLHPRPGNLGPNSRKKRKRNERRNERTSKLFLATLRWLKAARR